MEIKIKQIEKRVVIPTAGTTPPASPVNGETWFGNGVVWVYDSTRSKWLSIDRVGLEFGAQRSNGTYLNASGGNTSGYGGILRDGTIIGVMARAAAGHLTKTFEIRANGVMISTFSLVAGVYRNAVLNVDFNSGDWLGVWSSTAGLRVDMVSVILEIAWRL